MTTLESLAQAVRALREQRRLSQEALAARSGVHRNYIGVLERAERNPTYTRIRQVAHGLGISLSALAAEADTYLSSGPSSDGVTSIRDLPRRKIAEKKKRGTGKSKR